MENELKEFAEKVKFMLRMETLMSLGDTQFSTEEYKAVKREVYTLSHKYS